MANSGEQLTSKGGAYGAARVMPPTTQQRQHSQHESNPTNSPGGHVFPKDNRRSRRRGIDDQGNTNIESARAAWWDTRIEQRGYVRCKRYDAGITSQMSMVSWRAWIKRGDVTSAPTPVESVKIRPRTVKNMTGGRLTVGRNQLSMAPAVRDAGSTPARSPNIQGSRAAWQRRGLKPLTYCQRVEETSAKGRGNKEWRVTFSGSQVAGWGIRPRALKILSSCSGWFDAGAV